LEKEAVNGGTKGAKNGVESNGHVHIANGHTNGNGAESKTEEAAVSNGNGFRYNEYDGKA
jgi:hypothetical protein